MILTVLVGNTNTRFTWFVEDRVCRRSVLPTGRLPTVQGLLGAGRPEGVALASVVPELTRRAVQILKRVVGRTPFVLKPRSRTGLRFCYRRHEIGADRVCTAVGAFQRFRQDCIVLDFGTATTVNVVTGQGVYLGGAILPGLLMMLEGLARGTGQLPRVRPGLPRLPFGRNTQQALRAGVVGALVGGVEHIVADIERRTGRGYFVVATGGALRFLLPRITRLDACDPDLGARGLAYIYRLNIGG